MKFNGDWLTQTLQTNPMATEVAHAAPDGAKGVWESD